MHAAWVVVLVAQASVDTASTSPERGPSDLTRTSTHVDELLLEDLPLTDEELALLDSMEPADTATAAVEPGLRLVPTLTIPRDRLQGRNARSLGEASREEATPFSTTRGFVTGESPILRGRSGQRVQLTMDGLELRHALDSVDRSTTLGMVDPWVVEQLDIAPSAPLARGGFGGHGDVSIVGRRPRASPGLVTELRGLGRLADRSTGFRGAANAGVGPAAIAVAGGYSDHDPMRDGAGRQLPGTGDEESSLLSRARIFDQARDPVELDLGFDLFRITNAKRFDLDGRIDRLRSLVSGFGRVRAGAAATKLDLLAGARRFETNTEPASGGNRSTDAADIMQAELDLSHRLLDSLTLSVFGSFYTSGAHGDAVRGRMLRASGGVGAEMGLDELHGRAAIRGGYARSALEAGPEADQAFVLPELRLGWRFWGPLALFAGYHEALHAPTVLDLSQATTELALEHVRTVELGLGYDTPRLAVRGSAFSSFVEAPVELEADAFVNRGDLILLGGELEGVLRPFRGFELAVSLSSNRGLGDERARFIEGTVGALRLRYELGVRNAYVELAGRHALAFPGSAAGQDPNRRRDWPLPFVSLGGGLDLGLGFGINVQVANTLDVAERELNVDIPRPGVDLRFALDHRFEL